MKNVKINIFSRSPVTAEGIKNILNVKYPGTEIFKSNLNEITYIIRALHPNILLIDDFNIDEDELYFMVMKIKDCYSGLRIVLYTESTSAKFIFKLMELDVNYFFHKTNSVENILLAVESAVKGSDFFDKNIIRLFLNSREAFERYNFKVLSIREIQILQLIFKKMANKQISESLSISVKTVESHKEKIKKKMGLKSMQEVYDLQILKDMFTM